MQRFPRCRRVRRLFSSFLSAATLDDSERNGQTHGPRLREDEAKGRYPIRKERKGEKSDERAV